MIFNHILETIGRTPVVRLNRIGAELPCELYAKCEFFNPGGSVKDRAAYQMVIDAEKEGRIKRGDTLIEPSSGNTGIGLALAGAVLGYRVIITMPEKMSQEKQVVMEALGATIYRTPTAVAWDDEASYIMLAKRLQKEIPNAHLLDQYNNPSNPKAHYEYTAAEILQDFGADLQMIVMGVGTGGTLTGVARRLKKEIPGLKIIGADPSGSVLGGEARCQDPYLIEGIGYDFIPDVLDNKLVDRYYKTEDKASFLMARRLIREEGLLVGGSSGAAVCAMLEAAKSLKKGEKCLVLLPDSIRNYLTNFVDPRWMASHGFLSEDEKQDSCAVTG